METIARTNTNTLPNTETGFQFRKYPCPQKPIHSRSVPNNFTDTLNPALSRLHDLYSRLDIAPGGLKPDQVDTFLELRHQALQLNQQVDHLVELINLRSQFQDKKEREHLRKMICRNPDDILYEEALHHAQGEHRISDISIHVHSATVKINSDHLRIVMSELIQNAYQYSDRGSEVEVVSTLTENSLKIEIKDKGYGMSERKSEKLNTIASSDSDSLGLQIVHEVLTFFNGTFSLFSIPGNGTTVTFSIPLAEEVK
jgi:signal transduction histidine kinase